MAGQLPPFLANKQNDKGSKNKDKADAMKAAIERRLKHKKKDKKDTKNY